MNLKHKERS